MSVWAIMRVKDEVDVIEHTIRRLLEHVDHVLVADNTSTDGTREILQGLPVDLIDDPEVGYYQADAMTELADQARFAGATWVVPVDADEIWRPRTGERISDLLSGLCDRVLIVQAQLFDHVATAIDPYDPDPVARIGWRRPQPGPLPKVACRAIDGLRIHQGNHSAGYHGIEQPLTLTNALEVRHFPYRSIAQLVSKVRNGSRAYAETDMPEHVGAHWRQYGRILDQHGEQGLADLFKTWYWREDPTVPVLIEGEQQPPLVYDPVL